jgi:hypothetical protein
VWLCQIAKYTFYDYCRKNKLRDFEEFPEDTVDTGVSIENALEDEGTAELIHQILHDMKEPYKEVFTLRVFGELSFKQIVAVIKSNAKKIEYYNADFLRTTVFVHNSKSPSATYNTDSKNFWYSLRKFAMGFLGSAFAVSITKDLVLHFSIAALIEACIQITIIIVSSAFSTSFGWNLIMNTEMNRMKLQEKEVIECEKWTNENFPKA